MAPPLSDLLRYLRSPQPRQRLHRRVWDISNLHTLETFQTGCDNNFNVLSIGCVAPLGGVTYSRTHAASPSGLDIHVRDGPGVIEVGEPDAGDRALPQNAGHRRRL